MNRLSKLSRLVTSAKKYQVRLTLGVVCVTLSNLAAAVSPLLLKHAIDSLSAFISEERLFYFGALIVLFAVLEGIFLFLMRRIMIGASRLMEYDLRNDLFAHMLGLSRRYYQNHRTGDIMSRATNDLNAVRMMLGPGIMYSVNTVIRLAIVLFLMLRINVALTLFALISIPAVALAVRYFGSVIHHRFEKIQETFSEISARVQENLSGVRVIRAFTQEESEINEFKRLNLDYIQKNLQLIRVWGLFYPVLGFLLGLGGVFVLWYGGREVIGGRMTLGEFVAFNAYLGMLTWPMIALGWVINIVERGSASAGRMNQIFDTQPEIFDESVKINVAQSIPKMDKLPSEDMSLPPQIQGEIDIRNLSFAYNGQAVLKNINLRIPLGATYAIIGETGSGKSTLVSLLARVHDVTHGEILIDRVPIQKYSLQALRSSLGYVPQETFLFSETISENIAFGVDHASLSDIQEAARLAHILREVEEFPKQFNTMVGERGITLSGGQQQRTAIARALIRNPRILVLDDALSSVDTATEDKILSLLKVVMRDRTSLLISHRVSTVKFADQIIVLKGGEIVERGTHEELAGRDGYYADLYQKQLLEEELTES
ncbi:MAG: ABC transporter ATP-binding protein [Acidobacteria bacterium]|nr:ABC transporter ATP-binding protein [Acidobacteriota bacterium]